MTAHPSPIQSWNLILPCVLSASKSGATSPIRRLIASTPCVANREQMLRAANVDGAARERERRVNRFADAVRPQHFVRRPVLDDECIPVLARLEQSIAERHQRRG